MNDTPEKNLGEYRIKVHVRGYNGHDIESVQYQYKGKTRENLANEITKLGSTVVRNEMIIQAKNGKLKQEIIIKSSIKI